MIADADGVGDPALVQAEQPGRDTGGGHVAEEGGEMPAVLMDALARPGGEPQAADEVGADRHGCDELLAAHPAHVLTHGKRGRDGHHTRVHDGVLVDVVEVQRVGHGGVHLGRVGRRQPVSETKDRALRSATPLQHQVPHLGHAGLATTRPRATPKKSRTWSLVMLTTSGGRSSYRTLRKLATNDWVASGRVASVGAGLLCHSVLSSGSRSQTPRRAHIKSGLESGKCRLTAWSSGPSRLLMSAAASTSSSPVSWARSGEKEPTATMHPTTRQPSAMSGVAT